MEAGESIVPSCGIVGEDTRRTLRKIERKKTKTQDINTERLWRERTRAETKVLTLS